MSVFEDARAKAEEAGTLVASGDGWLSRHEGGCFRVDLFAPLVARPQIGVDLIHDCGSRDVVASRMEPAREALLNRCRHKASDPDAAELAVNAAWAVTIDRMAEAA